MNLTPEQKVKLERLVDLFLEWNGKMNLSSIRDKEGVWEKHIEDSLLPMEWFDFTNKRVLDIGTGGGFPVLPLGIMYPTSKFSALDSVGKKMKAVQSMADDLDIKLKAYHGRIEDFGQDPKFRAQFDLVTARALAPWPVLLEYALPFVKLGGSFIAYQGPQIETDLETFKYLERNLGGQVQRIEKTVFNGMERVFVEVKKVHGTTKKYPRENGIPRLNPMS